MINWQDIDTVFLDMDGTLLDLHFDNYFWMEHFPQRFSESKNMPLDDAKSYLAAQIQKREGTLDWYCLDHWSELTEMDVVSLKAELLHKIQIRPHAELFLQRLKALGKKLVLITNAHRAGLKIKLDVTNIDDYLDVVISSHDFSSPKEEAQFWQRLAQQEPFDPERSLFIDDNLQVLRSAQAHGIAHLVCITLPDSQQPAKNSEEFLGIEHFDAIMPPE